MQFVEIVTIWKVSRRSARRVLRWKVNCPTFTCLHMTLCTLFFKRKMSFWRGVFYLRNKKNNWTISGGKRKTTNLCVFFFLDNRCVLDSCGCDMGGDCECLCTSFAEYAQACNAHGIAIRWRSQELCRKTNFFQHFPLTAINRFSRFFFLMAALQCNEECSSYSPCMSTCPTVTCDNPLGSSSLCAADACVEGIADDWFGFFSTRYISIVCFTGCQPKECPKGQIHRSANELSCMPISDCASALCMVVDGVMYAEGDVIERDACHAW